MTRRPVLPVRPDASPSVPGGVYLGILVLLAIGLGEIAASLWVVRRWRRHAANRIVPVPQLQFDLWVVLLVAAAVAWMASAGGLGLVLLLIAQIVPRYMRRRDVKAKADRVSQPATT